MTRPLLLLLLLAGCAAGPRPLPESATPAERLAQAEAVLTRAKGLTARVVSESSGPVPAKLTTSLELVDSNALFLSADGDFGGKAVHLEVDTRKGDHLWSSSAGSSASNHHGPVPPALSEAVALGLVRLGLLHNLAMLSQDKPIEHAEGGLAGWAAVLEPKDLGADTVDGVPCHRVGFALLVGGKTKGEAELCLADATSLPLARKQTVHFEDGDLAMTERLTWAAKER